MGIYKNGFDSRYFRNDLNFLGNYGRGIYFADNPNKSAAFTENVAYFDNKRPMYVCEVALGKQ